MGKQAYRGYTQAQHEANMRYMAKTYKTFSLRLRIEDDADIIDAIEDAVEHGYSKREWLRELYEGKPNNRYTKEQIMSVFGDFKGVLTKDIIERMLGEID